MGTRLVAVPQSIGGPAAVATVQSRGSVFDEVSDPATLFLVGTLLVGAAAAVRKAA